MIEINARIDLLLDAQPIQIPPHRLDPIEFKKLKGQYNDLLDKGLIEHNFSP